MYNRTETLIMFILLLKLGTLTMEFMRTHFVKGRVVTLTSPAGFCCPILKLQVECLPCHHVGCKTLPKKQNQKNETKENP